MQKTSAIRLLIIAICLSFSHTATSQVLSPEAKISLLTCGSGEELYSTFGHSAIRVCDTTQNIDLVFNYGIFNFSDPNFYSNFVRGKLNYMLGVHYFQHFLPEYIDDGRWVYEQTLSLTTEQRQALFNFLLHNSLPENKYYLYDFLFDNCSSRIRDILSKVFPNQVVFPDKYDNITGKPTFRTLLHIYLNKSQWTKLGIDILLGKRVDRVATASEYMFLPDFLMQAFDKATINNQPLVSESGYLYHNDKVVPSTKVLFSPLLILSILLILVVIAHFAKISFKWIDFTLFFIVGLLGIFILFMWFGTDHYVTKYNFNLLWALPTHAVAAFFLLKKQRPRWILWYFLATIFLLVFSGLPPQPLNNALLPFVCMLAFRSYLIAKPLISKAAK